jgi:hypothetical protein
MSVSIAPQPETTIALIFGASRWPNCPKFQDAPSLERSADAFIQYIQNEQGLSVPFRNIKSFFNSFDDPAEQLDQARAFVARRRQECEKGKPISDLIFYYAGHGDFEGEGREFYLAIKRAHPDHPLLTNITAHSLGNWMRQTARDLRTYLIIDCCFAAALQHGFLSSPLGFAELRLGEALPDPIASGTNGDMPTSGVALLAAAGANDAAFAPPNEPYTRFTATLLEVLDEGSERLPSALSLSDVHFLVDQRIRRRYSDGPRPELRSLQQSRGRIELVPLFPNRAARRMEEKLRAGEAVRLAEGQRKAEESTRLTEGKPQVAVKAKFFISYAAEDAEWASWISQQLEAAHQGIIFHPLDIADRDGELNIQRALDAAEMVLVVWSQSYARLTTGELMAATRTGRDPGGTANRLIIVRIEDCKPPGPVKTDLFGVSEAIASQRLTERVRGGNEKPEEKGPFPFVKRVPSFPGAASAARSSSAEDATRPGERERKAEERATARLTKGNRTSGVGSPRNEVSSPRNEVFVSYSHRDERWLQQLRVVLAPLIRTRTIEFWDDTKIALGSKWRQEIRAALERARVAVLLISPDFLHSDFIAKDELPPLLAAANSAGLTVIWIPVRPSLVTRSPIIEFQAAISPARPLSMMRPAERETAFVRIAEAIASAVDVVHRRNAPHEGDALRQAEEEHKAEHATQEAGDSPKTQEAVTLRAEDKQKAGEAARADDVTAHPADI